MWLETDLWSENLLLSIMELTRPVVDRLTRGAPGMRVMNFPNNSWKHFLLTNNETRVSGFYWMGPVLFFYRPCNHLIFSIFKDFSHYTVYGHWFYLGTKKKKFLFRKTLRHVSHYLLEESFFHCCYENSWPTFLVLPLLVDMIHTSYYVIDIG